MKLYLANEFKDKHISISDNALLNTNKMDKNTPRGRIRIRFFVQGVYYGYINIHLIDGIGTTAPCAVVKVRLKDTVNQ